MDVETAAITEASTSASTTEDASSLLVLASPFADHTAAVCGDLLGRADPEATNYLSLTCDGTVADRLEHWRRHVAPELPAKIGLVTAGEVTRSATAASTTETTRYANADVRVTTVASPGDLTGLGLAVEKSLAAWNADEHRTVACLDSLTTLLQYVDAKRCFRFLHTLLERFEAVDATVHAHMDPGAHDPQTLATIACLFDVVVERDAPGEWQQR